MPPTIGYRSEGATIIAFDPANSQTLWRHEFPGSSVQQLLTLPGNPPSCVALVDKPGTPGHSKITRINADRSVAWTRLAPLTMATEWGDWLEIRLDGNIIRTNTWNGYLITLDPSDGRILSSEFTK